MFWILLRRIKYLIARIILTCLVLGSYQLGAQIIFSEPFDEANTSTTGNDNIGGVGWTTACPTCTTGDYFYVNGNTLECEDTNGPATWTTGNINTSSCTNGIIVSMDINLAAASNAFEECIPGCGCNCVDWISLEYDANGSGFVPLTSVEGGTCAQACSGGTYILIGALSSGTSFSYSVCLNPATTLQLKITVQTWANGEKYQIDNINVACSSCALPIELLGFAAYEKVKEVEVNWQTAMELNNDYFTVERSTDGFRFENIGEVDAVGNSNKINNYTFNDANPLQGISYYRLKQTDVDRTFTYSGMVVLERNKTTGTNISLVPNPTESGIFSINGLDLENGKVAFVEIMDYTGKMISKVNIDSLNSSVDLSTFSTGLYLVRLVNRNETFTCKLVYNR